VLICGRSPRGAFICESAFPRGALMAGRSPPRSPPRGMLADGGRGTDCGRIAGTVDRALSVGAFGLMPADAGRRPPRFSNPPAVGGCGIDRAPPTSGGTPPRVMLGEAFAPRGILSGRCTPRATVPGFWTPRALPISGRPTPPFVRKPAFPRLMGLPSRLTTGRENACGGGATRDGMWPPSIVVRVGRASTARTGVMRLNWFGATRILLCATGSEFTRVLRDTAVNPPGARMFA
jgi:hypothetical protein